MAVNFPNPDPTAWETWNVSVADGASTADRDFDRAALEKSISSFVAGPDANGVTCLPTFRWQDVDSGPSAQLTVTLKCTIGFKVASRIPVRPPAGTKPPPSRVSVFKNALTA